LVSEALVSFLLAAIALQAETSPILPTAYADLPDLPRVSSPLSPEIVSFSAARFCV
jgi:hypothetical protein